MTTTRPIRIVLLEDDDLDAELIVAQLDAGGLSTDVRRARTAEEYLQQLASQGIDLVLSDFALPGYDGMEALGAARERLPDVPFVFVSGAIGEERAIETLQRGATDYVLKSRLERLNSSVSRGLKLAEERRKRREAEAERDRLLESERASREAAEAANRMKDEFLAIASHELRTPLNAMLGWATLLSTAAPTPELLVRGLGIIKRNAQAQSRLIEDILDISRIVTGKLQLCTERLPLASFVQPAVEAIRPSAVAKGIEVTVELHEHETVEGDSGRLQQIVWNLLSNAVKFTLPQGQIRVASHREQDAVQIIVEDSGQGIDPAFLPHVFERFRQADASATRRASGLGLGLSIVRYLSEAHGGSVRAESRGLGQGSRFVVRLPRHPAHEQPAAVVDEPLALLEDLEESVTAPRSLEGVRVLLVEDDPDSRELVAFILRASGAEVAAAASVREASKLFESEPPSIVISDIGMPDVDGYSFIRSLRQRAADAGGRTPAIALTAYTRELDRRQAEAAGFQRHLSKPVTPAALIRCVTETLTAHQARAAAGRI